MRRVRAMSTPLGKCLKCHREINLPSLDGIEQAAEELDRETFAGRGSALAYLWMVASCLRGLCILCTPERLPRVKSALRTEVAS